MWNHDGRCERLTEVRTFWFDLELPARQFAANLDGDVRVFVQPQSFLGAFRVVSYRPWCNDAPPEGVLS
jgi:hypothetical protein